MRKSFIYKRLTIFMGYGAILLFGLAIASWLLLVGPAPKNKDEVFMILPLFFLFSVFIISLVGWIVVMLKTRICVDEKGIYYSSPLKQVVIPWPDITTIKHKYISNLSPGKFGGPPRDLLIKTNKDRTLKIYAFLRNTEEDEGVDDNGIQDFEAEIKKYVQGINIG